MARSRNRRRRQGVIIALAVLVSASAIAFAEDITRYAHGSSEQQASLNRSFKGLSTSILTEENKWGAAVSELMASAPSMTRTSLSTTLGALRLNGQRLLAQTRVLDTPRIHGDVQATLIQVTGERVSAVEHLFGSFAGPLELPGAAPGAPAEAVQHVIALSNEQWGAARDALQHEPGGVVLIESDFALATDPLASEVAAIVSSPSLAPTRSAAIVAVSVSPAPLPAPAGTLHLVPTTTLRVGVSVLNEVWIRQGVSVSVSIRPINARGRAQSATQRATAAPGAAVAVVFSPFAVVPGERAVMTVTLSGVASGPSGSTRTYQLVVAATP